jgi:hypothetical protein
MSTIFIEPVEKSRDTMSLVKSAIEREINTLGLALKMADGRLTPFEKKYGVTSDYFMTQMAAEDLDHGDEEYVQWAGEYKLKLRLQEKLARLQEINYSDPGLLRSNQGSD